GGQEERERERIGAEVARAVHPRQVLAEDQDQARRRDAAQARELFVRAREETPHERARGLAFGVHGARRERHRARPPAQAHDASARTISARRSLSSGGSPSPKPASISRATPSSLRRQPSRAPSSGGAARSTFPAAAIRAARARGPCEASRAAAASAAFSL